MRQRLFELGRFALACCLFGWCGGCERAEQPAPQAESLVGTVQQHPVLAPRQWKPDELLGMMRQVYRQVDHYRDNAVARLRYVQAGEVFTDEAPLAVRFSRPNRLGLRAYQVRLGCDGGRLVAVVEDPDTGNLDGQVIDRPADAQLTLASVLGDPVLADVLSRGLCGLPLQLELLLSEEPLLRLQDPAIAKEMLAPANIDNEPCHRLRLTTPQGDFIAWIRAADLALRRLEYPPPALTVPGVSNMRLDADFRDAVFAPAPVSQFALEVPPHAKRVQRLVPPPRPLPTRLLGQLPAPFYLRLLDGRVQHRDQMLGRAQVLVWFRLHPTCIGGLQQIERVKSSLSAESQVRFYAITSEPSTVSGDAISRQLGQWNISFPMARDVEAFGRDVFGIQELPAVVVLDAKGRVQAYEVGNHPELGSHIREILQALAKGRDPAAEILAQADQARLVYQQDLIAAGAAGIKLASSTRPARSEPKKLHLQRVWTTTDVPAAGNVFAAGDGLLYALSGARSVAVLDASGQILQAVHLPLPPEASVTEVRIQTDADGRRFALAWPMMGRQAFVFDEQWNLLAAYPPATDQHPGIADARLQDLDQDGQLELYVAFAGEAGVHRADLLGRRVWTNRVCPDVRMLAAASQPEPALLAVGPTGMLYPLTATGNDLQPQPLSGWPLLELHGWDGNAESFTQYCGLSLNSLGRRVAIGLGPSLDEVWRYDLPEGVFARPLRPVASGSLWEEDSGHWIIAGPDGSLHLIKQDGSFFDFFFYGAPVHGLALLGRADPLLVISAEQAITAWRVRR